MSRVGLDTGFPASNPWHRFTLTRLPEPSVLAPIGTELAESSWGGPSSFGSSTTTPLPTPHPKVTPHPPSEDGGSPGARRRQVCPVASTLAPVSRGVRRLVVALDLPKEFDSPVRGGREHCPCPDPAALPRAAWAGPKPPPHRSGRRALSGTIISKDAVKPLVKRYFEIHRVIPETFSLPPGFRPSSTRFPPFMHSDVHSAAPIVTRGLHPVAEPGSMVRDDERTSWRHHHHSVEHVAPPRVRRAALRAALSVLGSTS